MKVTTPGHTYELSNFEDKNGSQTLQFIHKEPAFPDTLGSAELKTISDGTTNEEVLEVLIDRIAFSLQGNARQVIRNKPDVAEQKNCGQNKKKCRRQTPEVMERMVTFTDKDLNLLMFSVYHEIGNSARSAALLHTSTIEKDNNPFHFEQVVKQSNEAIKRLTQLLPPTDTRRGEFVLLDEKKLIKEAKEFFARDIY